MFNKDLETLTSKQTEMNNTIAEMKTTLEGINSRMSPVYFFFNINLFIYFWLRWVFVAARGLSLVAASGGYSALRCAGFSLRWLLLLWSTGSRHVGFSSCGAWAQ